MNMKQRLKILHLEDLPTDVELVDRELKKSGMQYESVVVSNEQDFSRELLRFSPDIVLSDHSLPTFNSFGALKILREQQIKIPFILITSTTSEEVSVQVMKEGAWDYILKDRMQRLPSAIEQAIDKYNVRQAKKKTESDLEAAHHKLLFHFENSPLGFVEWDNHFNVKHWSPRAEEIFGWTTQEYQDLQIQGFNAVYEDDYPIAVQKALELTSGGVSSNHFLNRANTKSGKVIWCEWFNSVQKNSDGEVMTIMSLVSDVTEKKHAEEKLAANEKRFRSLIENISDAIVVSDADSNILYQSPSVERILGYSEEERLNKSLKSFIHPDYSKQYAELFQSVLKNAGQPHPFEFPFLHKKGSYVWLEGITTNLLNDLSVNGVIANYRDVTQRKMLNKILQEYNDRHEIVSRATNDAIWDWDIENDFEIWNHGTQTIFGYNEREVGSSRNWWKEKLHPMDYERVNQELEESFKRKTENWISQYQYLCANGNYKYVLDRAFILYREDKPVRMIGAMQDITEQVVAAQELRSLNERYEIVLDTTGDAIWDWDLLSNEITWGEGLFKLFGYQAKAAIRSSFWFDKIHNDDRKRVEQLILEVVSNSRQFKWEDEYQFRKSDGTYSFVHNRGKIVRNKEGKATRMVGSIQDITERKLALEEIEKLSLVASKTDNIVIITDAEKRIEWVNESFVKRTGYTSKEAIGLTPRILQGPETDPYIVSRIQKHLEAGQPVIEEILNYSKNGSKYWLRLNINPVFNNKGELTKFIAVETDITHQKEYEANIVAIARELTELIEHANVPIFGVDRNGYINEWNKTTAAISEYNKNEALGKKWINFIDPTVHKKASQIIENAFAGKQSVNFELPFVSKSGKQFILVISISTRRDRNKNIIGALCVGQDLTEVIQYRQGLENLVQERTLELNQALKKEKELVELKSKFVSTASHEFRTPLSTISLATGFIRRYKQQIVPEEIDKKLDNIEKQVNQMVYLLDDVLLVGKAEAGKILVNRSEIEIETFKTLAAEVIESKRTKHRLHFSNECTVSSIMTDEKLVRNIIINLITNAVKFSPEAGKIEMNISCDLHELILTIKDQGIGIPEKDLKNLFTSFSRGSNVGTIEGTGLGLSIVKKAVDLLNGTIELKSILGKGTEFKVTLPLEYA